MLRRSQSEAGSERSGPVRVLLVDDHPVCRAGLRSMLENSEFRIVAEAETAEAARKALPRLEPDLVLLEIRIPTGEGLNLLKSLAVEHPETRLVVVTTYDHPIYHAGALAAGAWGYLLKGAAQEELLGALRSIASAKERPELREVIHALARSESVIVSPDLLRPLSDRESEVLRLLGLGLRNGDIARFLSISETTVRTHVEHILTKLGLSDRLQAAVWAARHSAIERRTSVIDEPQNPRF